MDINYPLRQDVNYNTIFGNVKIKLDVDKYQKISPSRKRFNNVGEQIEHGYPISEFKVQNVDFFKKINLSQIKFIFIDDFIFHSNSYSPESKTIYIVKLKKEIQGAEYEIREKCFLNSVLHEVGHAVCHPSGGEENLEKELEAWLYSLKESQKFFGLIKKEYLKVLEEYIVYCLKEYCNNRAARTVAPLVV